MLAGTGSRPQNRHRPGFGHVFCQNPYWRKSECWLKLTWVAKIEIDQGLVTFSSKIAIGPKTRCWLELARTPEIGLDQGLVAFRRLGPFPELGRGSIRSGRVWAEVPKPFQNPKSVRFQEKSFSKLGLTSQNPKSVRFEKIWLSEICPNP